MAHGDRKYARRGTPSRTVKKETDKGRGAELRDASKGDDGTWDVACCSVVRTTDRLGFKMAKARYVPC